MLSPSYVLVPRPISSRIISDLSVELFKMFAVSFISTMKVELPRASSSLAPTLLKILSTSPILHSRAGTKEPVCAISAMRAIWRM